MTSAARKSRAMILWNGNSLALHNKTFPPSINFKSARPDVEMDKVPLQVQTACEPWETDRQRMVGVSAFGFGGTNFHVVLKDVDPLGEFAQPIDQVEQGLVGARPVGHGLGDGSSTLRISRTTSEGHRPMVAMDESLAGWPGARGYPPVRGLPPFAVVARFKDASDEDLPRRGGSAPGDAFVGRLRGSRRPGDGGQRDRTHTRADRAVGG